MTKAAEGEMSQLQVKGFDQCKELGAVWMMNMGYQGVHGAIADPRRRNSEVSQERILTHHLLHTGLELRA